MTNRRQDNGEDTGTVHLPGLDAHDHQTFCGHSWNSIGRDGPSIRYVDTDDPVDCKGCLRAVAEAQKLLRSYRHTASKRAKLDRARDGGDPW